MIFLWPLTRKKATVLVLLDLSAAFDTIDHNILLQRMDTKYGVRGVALDWFWSYLSDRTQAVKIKTSFSSASKLLFGVPQGSVLGPTLFSLYSSSIADIARKHGLSVHLYADDTDLYHVQSRWYSRCHITNRGMCSRNKIMDDYQQADA